MTSGKMPKESPEYKEYTKAMDDFWQVENEVKEGEPPEPNPKVA